MEEERKREKGEGRKRRERERESIAFQLVSGTVLAKITVTPNGRGCPLPIKGLLRFFNHKE